MVTAVERMIAKLSLSPTRSTAGHEGVPRRRQRRSGDNAAAPGVQRSETIISRCLGNSQSNYFVRKMLDGQFEFVINWNYSSE